MADPNIVFWAAIPDGAKLTATASKQDGSPGTFAVTGYCLDEEGNDTKITGVPYQRVLNSGHIYQLVLEVLPVDGAIVDVEVKIEHGGSVIRKTDWTPVQGAPGMRGAFIRPVSA